jgi:hypothetical protein
VVRIFLAGGNFFHPEIVILNEGGKCAVRREHFARLCSFDGLYFGDGMSLSVSSWFEEMESSFAGHNFLNVVGFEIILPGLVQCSELNFSIQKNNDNESGRFDGSTLPDAKGELAQAYFGQRRTSVAFAVSTRQLFLLPVLRYQKLSSLSNLASRSLQILGLHLWEGTARLG